MYSTCIYTRDSLASQQQQQQLQQTMAMMWFYEQQAAKVVKIADAFCQFAINLVFLKLFGEDLVRNIRRNWRLVLFDRVLRRLYLFLFTLVPFVVHLVLGLKFIMATASSLTLLVAVVLFVWTWGTVHSVLTWIIDAFVLRPILVPDLQMTFVVGTWYESQTECFAAEETRANMCEMQRHIVDAVYCPTTSTTRRRAPSDDLVVNYVPGTARLVWWKTGYYRFDVLSMLLGAFSHNTYNMEYTYRSSRIRPSVYHSTERGTYVEGYHYPLPGSSPMVPKRWENNDDDNDDSDDDSSSSGEEWDKDLNMMTRLIETNAHYRMMFVSFLPKLFGLRDKFSKGSSSSFKYMHAGLHTVRFSGGLPYSPAVTTRDNQEWDSISSLFSTHYCDRECGVLYTADEKQPGNWRYGMFEKDESCRMLIRGILDHHAYGGSYFDDIDSTFKAD